MTLTVRLESATENALASFCSSQDMTKSQVVHQALSSWFKKQPASAGHALLAYLPQLAPSRKAVASKAMPPATSYEAYSKTALRSRAIGSAVSKKV